LAQACGVPRGVVCGASVAFLKLRQGLRRRAWPRPGHGRRRAGGLPAPGQQVSLPWTATSWAPGFLPLVFWEIGYVWVMYSGSGYCIARQAVAFVGRAPMQQSFVARAMAIFVFCVRVSGSDWCSARQAVAFFGRAFVQQPLVAGDMPTYVFYAMSFCLPCVVVVFEVFKVRPMLLLALGCVDLGGLDVIQCIQRHAQAFISLPLVRGGALLNAWMDASSCLR